jgi:chromosome segregation ATPase
MSVVDISKVKAAPVQDAEIVSERTPEIVAAEIRQIADQTRKMVLNSSIEIGKRLCEAKEMVPHGEWAAWLEKNVDFSQSSANNFMKIYTEYGDIQGELWGASAKSQTFGNLSYSQAVALLAVPAEEREEFVKENDAANMSTRELQEAIKARDEAIKARDEAMDDCVKADTAKLEAEEKLKEEMKAADERVRAAQRQAESFMEELDKLQAEIKNSKDKEKITKLKEELRVTKERLRSEEATKKGFMDTAFKEKKAQEEEIERLKKELAAAEAKEPEPSAEMQAEIDRLQEKLQRAEQLGMERLAADEETARFKVLYQTVQNNFSDLMDALACIKDPEAKGKRKVAVGKLLERMMEELDHYE